MPPLDERMYQALKSAAIAILDPFPVGMHIPILDAIEEGIPVVSEFHLSVFVINKLSLFFLSSPGVCSCTARVYK